MRLADTLAAELAQESWRGMDAPAAEPTTAMLRHALAEGLPGDVSLEDVGEWSQSQLTFVSSAPNLFSLEQRFYGAIVGALILGAKLQETAGT